jgi:hypothetical protein
VLALVGGLFQGLERLFPAHEFEPLPALIHESAESVLWETI